MFEKPTRWPAFRVISIESFQICPSEVIDIKSTDEECLLRALRGGDEAALRQIIRLYSGYVGTIVWNIIGSSMTASDAEEVVADVFYVLWQNADKVLSGSLRGYLASIARSRAKNKLRERHIELYLEDDFLELPDYSQEERLSEGEIRSTLLRAMESLSQRDRDILVRHYYYCQSTADISAEIGIPRETVKTRLKAGRAALKKILSKEAI